MTSPSGAAPRRAVGRWAYRMFVRERRQQLVIVGVISIAVAAAVCAVSAMFNLPDPSAATFGTAQHRITYGSTDRESIADQTFATQLGGQLSVGGRQLTVVGIVENPYDLGDEFFLLPPSDPAAYESATVLADGTEEQLLSSLSDACASWGCSRPSGRRTVNSSWS